MGSHNQRLGKRGEAAAANFLASQGYTVLGENLRTPYGEIDLLAEDAGMLVFVEVKTRTSTTFGAPEEAVTPAKLTHMHEAALHLIDTQPETYGDRPFRFDVIAVFAPPGGKPQIRHIVDVRP